MATMVSSAVTIPPCTACGSPSAAPAFTASDWYLGRAAGSFEYHRCLECGTVSMHPQVDDETLAVAYATDYGPHSSSPSLLERLGERVAQREANRLVANADPTSALLDVGCGRGTFLRRLQRARWQGPMQGLEPDEATAEVARRESGMQIAVGTLEESVIEPGSVGTLVMRHVIEHVRDPRAALDQVSRALAPEGVLYLATPDARALAASFFGRFWHGYDPPRHFYAFTSRGMRELLASSGFHVLAEHWDFSPQMWTGSLRHALGRGRRKPWVQVLGHDLNPIAALPAAAAGLAETALRRTTMYAVTAKRAVA